MPNYCHCQGCEKSGIYRCLGCNGFHQQWKTTQQITDSGIKKNV